MLAAIIERCLFLALPDHFVKFFGLSYTDSLYLIEAHLKVIIQFVPPKLHWRASKIRSIVSSFSLLRGFLE